MKCLAVLLLCLAEVFGLGNYGIMNVAKENFSDLAAQVEQVVREISASRFWDQSGGEGADALSEDGAVDGQAEMLVSPPLGLDPVGVDVDDSRLSHVAGIA